MKRVRCRWPYTPWECSCCGASVEGRAPSSALAGLACDDCLDAGRKGEPFIALTVGPARPVRRLEDRPIVGVSMGASEGVTEAGDLFDLAGLVDRVRERKPGECGFGSELPDRLPPAIIVTDHALDLLAFLDASRASRSPFWQYQVKVRAGGAWRPEARSKRVFLTPLPVRFGYASRRGRKTRATGRSHWFLLIQPSAFCEVPDGWGPLTSLDLLRFGMDLREWANRQRVPVLQAVSAYGVRLLRDSRFAGGNEGGWRRKIPAATNRRLRAFLPGNHYQLLGRREHTYSTVHKYDQAGAHHYAALTSQFPHPDSFRVDGWFRRPEPIPGTLFDQRGPIRVNTQKWGELTRNPGLFIIGVSVPELVAADNLEIPALRRPGQRWQILTSVELEHARQVPGVRLLDIWACWTSPDQDDRLPEYALWAGQQLAGSTDRRRRWLKPLLLVAYGMLAVRPGRFRTAWRWCARPDGAVGWQTRYGHLTGYERIGSTERESPVANVAWRAIIESKVRLQSLQFARELRSTGMRPIAVYADAVFATGRQPNGPLLPPWRYEGMIHDLIFESPGRYRSVEETRLPGVPRARDRLIAHNHRRRAHA